MTAMYFPLNVSYWSNHKNRPLSKGNRDSSVLFHQYFLTQSIAWKNIINAAKAYKCAIKEFRFLHIQLDSPAAQQQKPKQWNLCALRWCSSQRDLPTPACLHLQKKIKETFPYSHVIIVLWWDSAWTLDSSNCTSMESLNLLQIIFSQREHFTKGWHHWHSHADLLCSFKDSSQKLRSWKHQNLPQFDKKAKNLGSLRSRTKLLADRKTTIS